MVGTTGMCCTYGPGDTQAGHDTNTGPLCAHQESTDSQSAINGGSGKTASPLKRDERSKHIAFVQCSDGRCCHAPSLLSQRSPPEEALGERSGIFQNYFLLCLPSTFVQHLLSAFPMAPGSSICTAVPVSPQGDRVLGCALCLLLVPGSAPERSPLAFPLPAKSFPAPSAPWGTRPSPRPRSDPPARPHFPSAAQISNLRTKGGRGLRRPPSYPITRLEQPARAGIPAPTCTTRPRGSGTAHRDLRPPQRSDAARPRRHLLGSPRRATSAGGGGVTPSPVATHSQLLALAEKVARMMSSKERRKYSGLILEGRRGMV